MGKRRGKSVDQARLQQRQSTLAEIREKYSRFGDEVVQYLTEKSFQRGGLRRTAARVLRPLPLEEDRMHEALVRFLSTQGVQAFFDRVEQGDEEANRERLQKLEDNAQQIAQTGGYRPQIIRTDKGDERRLHGASIPLSHLADSSRTPEITIDSPTPQAPPPNTETPPVAPKPAPLPPGAPWDGVDRRSGQERRHGQERRSGKDRRKSVEVVFNNRRFGTDRRTGIERRSGRDRRKNPPGRSEDE
jgi:hypothetical protein